ncbi:MAG: (d)CMP kinase [Alphaproteobacteria bacterium GM202ARS2]|nr:(d)CMP kinase [Alphaproteobacteria bacterium GM202ARS2]
MNPVALPILITIDGPAASGKGTLARNLGAMYQLQWLDSGLIYRALAFELAEHSWGSLTAHEQYALLSRLKEPSVLDNPRLRLDAAAAHASRIAQDASLRQSLLPLQREMAYHPPPPLRGTIMDGRDIGTVVLPEAPYKIYLTADPTARAKRRNKELQKRGTSATLTSVLADIEQRDHNDRERTTAPLTKAENSIVIDSSQLSIQQMTQQACQKLQQKGLLKPRQR